MTPPFAPTGAPFAPTGAPFAPTAPPHLARFLPLTDVVTNVPTAVGRPSLHARANADFFAAHPLLAGRAMFHLVAHAAPDTLLFRTNAEASRLFGLFTDTFPEAEAICIMPDHGHVLSAAEDGGRLTRLMSAYTRWRNHARGEQAPVWRPRPEPKEVADAKHLRRTVRYVHLNPCRAELVGDPIAWPWSTHRDAVGFAAPTFRRPERDPARFHRWVSADPTVDVRGTALPETRWGEASWDAVLTAVSAVCRVPIQAITSRGPARTLALRTAWLHELQDAKMLAAHVGVEPAWVYRVVKGAPPRGLLHRDAALHACVRAVGDPRLAALDPGDLRRLPSWQGLRHKR